MRDSQDKDGYSATPLGCQGDPIPSPPWELQRSWTPPRGATVGALHTSRCPITPLPSLLSGHRLSQAPKSLSLSRSSLAERRTLLSS